MFLLPEASAELVSQFTQPLFGSTFSKLTVSFWLLTDPCAGGNTTGIIFLFTNRRRLDTLGYSSNHQDTTWQRLFSVQVTT